MSFIGDILLLGGTGAMGVHLSELLAKDGWGVVVTTRSKRDSSMNVEYVQGNAKDPAFLEGVLGSRHWDVVVDFMVWATDEFRKVRDLLLGSCAQYMFLSSYRVFAASPVVDERSPRLLDACGDEEYLSTDEYALAKARQEDQLRFSGRGNWTIVRPAVTYSKGRYQLGVLECAEWLPRVLAGHAVPVPAEMLATQATMTWGGDVAAMMARLCGNAAALGEDFNACTSRHRTWGEVVEAYRAYVPVDICECSTMDYERWLGRTYQIRYDRLVDRVMDNSKVLEACGMSESDTLSLEEGLERDLVPFLSDLPARWPGPRMQGRLDRLTGELYAPGSLPSAGMLNYAKYLFGKYVG